MNPQGGASGEERLSVYTGGYAARIQESLREVYETVSKVLGAESFSELCHAYAHRYPSHDYNLNFIGKHLPEFLDRSKEPSFLSDLARLEWMVWRAFHAFDQPPLDATKLAEIPMEDWETARIIFQPSVSILVSQWSILNLWKARRDLPSHPEASRQTERILIGRSGDQVRCQLLSEAQFELINQLLQSRTLGAVLEDLADSAAESGAVTTWFSSWVQEGLIVRCEFLQQTPLNPSRRKERNYRLQ